VGHLQATRLQDRAEQGLGQTPDLTCLHASRLRDSSRQPHPVARTTASHECLVTQKQYFWLAARCGLGGARRSVYQDEALAKAAVLATGGVWLAREQPAMPRSRQE